MMRSQAGTPLTERTLSDPTALIVFLSIILAIATVVILGISTVGSPAENACYDEHAYEIQWETGLRFEDARRIAKHEYAAICEQL